MTQHTAQDITGLCTKAVHLVELKSVEHFQRVLLCNAELKPISLNMANYLLSISALISKLLQSFIKKKLGE